MGKKKALAIFDYGEDWRVLNSFSQPGSTHDEVACVGELFLLKLYGAVRYTSLDKHRYIQYMRRVSRTSVFSARFQPERCPPTSAAAKYHSDGAYLTVQQWSGNRLISTEWGWQFRDGMLFRRFTDRPVAPDRVLHLVSCGCKGAAGRN